MTLERSLLIAVHCLNTCWLTLVPALQKVEERWDTVNDRLSAAALIKVFRFLGAALIRLRRLFGCGAYFKD